MSGFRTLAPQQVYRFTVDANSNTSITVASGVAKKAINVISVSLSASGAGTVALRSNTTNILPNEFKAADPTWVLPKSEDSWAECSAGEDLIINNASGLTLNGVVVYIFLGDGR